jgi:hypothetical protein
MEGRKMTSAWRAGIDLTGNIWHLRIGPRPDTCLTWLKCCLSITRFMEAQVKRVKSQDVINNIKNIHVY